MWSATALPPPRRGLRASEHESDFRGRDSTTHGPIDACNAQLGAPYIGYFLSGPFAPSTGGKMGISSPIYFQPAARSPLTPRSAYRTNRSWPQPDILLPETFRPRGLLLAHKSLSTARQAPTRELPTLRSSGTIE